ncbi:MAG: YggT family protein [bacterium]
MVYALVYRMIDMIFQAAYLILIVRVLLSWIPHNAYHPIISLIYKCTDPMLRPFQNIVPSWRIGIDLSPIFAFIALGILRRLLFTLI